MFAVGVYVFGLLGSGRSRWLPGAGAWPGVCTAGCGFFAVVVGLLSIWSQDSSPSHQPGPGPGIGLIIALDRSSCVLTITVGPRGLVASRRRVRQQPISPPS